jgi:signal transduction histidine kinase
MIETKSLEEEIHHLSKIVNSLSYLCSQHEKEVTLHSVALVSIIKKVEAVLTATYPLAKINFTQDKTNTVQSNEIYLHIIIKNIVENGLKYSGENKTVDITRDNKEQTLSIQDYGQ